MNDIRFKKIERAQAALKKAMLQIKSKGVFITLHDTFQTLVTLGYSDAEGVEPLDTRPLIDFVKRIVTRANGEMDAEAEETNSLIRDLDSLYYSGDIDEPIKTLNSIDILMAIIKAWDTLKNDQETYHILMYTMSYSRINESIITEADKEELAAIINDLVDTPIN